MVSPRIALRYRDAVPGIDTIAAHQEVIEQYGSVLWGWWKKGFEPSHNALLEELRIARNFQIFIIDRTNETQFLAIATEVLAGEKKIDDDFLIPAYYRAAENDVFSWFKLTSITSVPYISDLASKFKDGTLVDMSIDAPTELSRYGKTINARDKSCILHLSDLHFGKDYRFLPSGATADIGDDKKSLTECLISDLERRGYSDCIGALILTGDITTQSDWRHDLRKEIIQEFTHLTERLKIPLDNIIILPGNHDVERYPKGSIESPAAITVKNQISYDHESKFRGFLNDLSGTDYGAPLNDIHLIELAERDVLICTLNSCSIAATQWTEYGYVGQSGWDVIEKLKDMGKENKAIKILALHHHLLPIMNVAVPESKGVSLTLDAANILELAQEAGVQLALHGHQHKAKITKYETITGNNEGKPTALHILSNGSASVKQERLLDSDRNAYCVISPQCSGVTVTMAELKSDGTKGQTIFDGELPS